MTKMRSASREALGNLSDRFGTLAKNLDNKALSTLSSELVSVAKMLDSEIVVTRYLTVSAEDAAPRVRLIERLVSGKVSDATLDVLRAAVSERWSANSDLIDAIEHISRQALLEVAEREDRVDEVEEQLFRFSRVLDAQPRLGHPVGRLRRSRRRAGRACCARCFRARRGRVNPVARVTASARPSSC